MVFISSKIDYRVFEKIQKIANANEMPVEKIVRLYEKRRLSEEELDKMLSSLGFSHQVIPESEVVTKTVSLCSP